LSEYAVTRIQEIDEIDDGREPMRPVRHHFGITSFGITAWTAREAGSRIINEHDEEGEDEELYLVQQGHARFELNGQSVDAPAGTLVYAKPGVKRTAFAEQDNTTIVVVGGRPGQAYEVNGWEVWSPLNQLYAEGRYAEAADRGKELVVENPGLPNVFYNLACCEALAGRSADAIEHVRQAIELSPRFREFAQGDSDFAAIRDEPGFKEAVGS
jgi:tetratricopeptide (TPR) repeat protein